VTEEDVASFLRANPGFLAGRPELYGALMPPRRTHGPVLADHMAAMIQAGRHEVARVLEAGRARQGLGARVGRGGAGPARDGSAPRLRRRGMAGAAGDGVVRLLAEGEPRRHLVRLRDGEAAPPAAGRPRRAAGRERLRPPPRARRRRWWPARRWSPCCRACCWRSARASPGYCRAQAQPLAYLGRALAARLAP
jgi:hypothetical protein